MAYKKIYSRVMNSPTTDYPTVLITEYQRLQAAGTVTRTIEHVTDPSALLAQNIGPNKQKYIVTEVWTSQAARRSYTDWCNSNHPGAHEAWMAANNCTQTEISSGEI